MSYLDRPFYRSRRRARRLTVGADVWCGLGLIAASVAAFAMLPWFFETLGRLP